MPFSPCGGGAPTSPDLSSHFEGKDPRLAKTFQQVLAAAKKAGPIEVAPTASSILLRADANFANVFVRRAWLDVEFLLDHDLASPRIHKRLKLSAKRYALTVRVPLGDPIDAELAGWIREARALRAG